MSATRNIQTGTSGDHRLLRGQRARSPAAPHGPPDAGVLAREAVIGFLREASAATAERAADRADAAAAWPPEPEAMPQDTVSAASHVSAEPPPWSLAAVSAAALDRIEAAAAKVEADIAVAHRAYEELQAGAGAAAEAAVHAAESAMASGRIAVEAERRARITLHQVRQNVVITAAFVVIVIICLLIAASVVH